MPDGYDSLKWSDAERRRLAGQNVEFIASPREL